MPFIALIKVNASIEKAFGRSFSINLKLRIIYEFHKAAQIFDTNTKNQFVINHEVHLALV